MKLSNLAAVAVLLGVLLVGIVSIGLDRLGYGQSYAASGFVFENVLLKVPPGTWVRMRPMQEGVGEVRLLFALPVVEPEINRDKKPNPATDLPPLPFVHMVSQSKRAGDGHWSRGGDHAAILATIGARGLGEWLEEIRPVRERMADGTVKTMLRATYGGTGGAQVAYFYDPSDPHPERRGYGWVRMETYGKDDLAEVLFAIPDGKAEVLDILPTDD